MIGTSNSPILEIMRVFPSLISPFLSRMADWRQERLEKRLQLILSSWLPATILHHYLGAFQLASSSTFRGTVPAKQHIKLNLRNSIGDSGLGGILIRISDMHVEGPLQPNVRTLMASKLCRTLKLKSPHSNLSQCALLLIMAHIMDEVQSVLGRHWHVLT